MSKLLKSSGVFAVMTLLSRMLGLVRDVVIANYFTEALTDVFFTALRIPNTLRRFFGEGGFANAFVPVLNETKETQSDAELQSLINHVFGVLGTILLVITAFGILFSGGIIGVIGVGFADEPTKAQLGATMLRITFPYILFISLTAFFAGILNTYQKFALPAFAPALLNLSLIAGALLCRDFFDPPILVLAWAVFVGGLAQFLLQIPTLWRLKRLPKPQFDLAHRGVRKILKLMVPTLLGSSAGQINVLLNNMLASSLTAGSITWLYYSDRLVELPIALIGVALGVVILPRLSALKSQTNACSDTILDESNAQAFRQTLTWAFRVALLVGSAATTGLAVLAFPLMMTLLQRGEFSVNSAHMAAKSLTIFALGGLFWVLVKVLAPGFYSRHDTKTPAKIAVFCIGVNIVFALLLFRQWGHVGLATAATISAGVNSSTLMFLLWRDGLLVFNAEMLLFIGKLIGANLMMGSAVFALEKYLTLNGDWVDFSLLQRIVALLLLIISGAFCYAVTLLVLRVKPRELLRP